MRRVERKAGEGCKGRYVLLVMVFRTFTNCNHFVDEFVDARLFEFGKGKQQNHAWDRICNVALPNILCLKSYSRLRMLLRFLEFLEGELKY